MSGWLLLIVFLSIALLYIVFKWGTIYGLNSVNLPMFVTDKQGKISFANKAARARYAGLHNISNLPDTCVTSSSDSLLAILFGPKCRLVTLDAIRELPDDFAPDPLNTNLIHTVIQDIPDAIGMMDHNFRYLACNPAFVKPLGIKDPGDLLGKTLKEVAPREIYLKFNVSDRNVLNTGKPFLIVDESRDDKGLPVYIDARKFRYIHPETQKPGVFIIARDVTKAEITRRELNEARDNFKKLSMIDSLTQVGNRRLFNESLSAEWRNHIRNNMPFSLIMCDIDEFKKLNDSRGHIYGDEVLVAVASALKKALKRPMDNVYRYGGEEFAFILCDTDSSGAGTVANRIHYEIEALKIANPHSVVKEFLTVSLGVYTCYPEAKDESLEALMLVDQALYRAKHEGRNKTVQAGQWYEKSGGKITV
ncbi:GGDEF domain-containing protein [Vibrio sp. JC009]|uniref:sensor domain-containing diguanylate cyclase n=1 Tax=Vibrio sp. JC009 TaxID=2912314 RepID=UPI0023B1B13D|nr:GGDEF domain-containing protein [Vibrio sp. JC009]WED20663.1 GGDEF domain-containing protein [Vibrio sp. JC009]